MNNKIIYWSGCNYWINKGKNKYEPIGTATSIHECTCTGEELEKCKLKKLTEVWKIYKE